MSFSTASEIKISDQEDDERWKPVDAEPFGRDEIVPFGKISLTVENEDGTKASMVVRNKVLLTGRMALAASLANQYNGEFPFYIVRMLFGNNGTVGGAPRFVNDSMDGLFGPATLIKPVIASIDPDLPQEVTFTSTIVFSELVGQVINEMSLEMANGHLFSMATFGDINKTATMQLIWAWGINFL